MSYLNIQKGDLYTWVRNPGGPTYVIEEADQDRIYLRQLFKFNSITCTPKDLLNKEIFRFDGTLSNP